MAQRNSLKKIKTAGSPTTPKDRASPTFEQLLHGDASSWESSPAAPLGKDHEHGEHHDHHNKRSVLTKLKETARKVKNSLSKKHQHGHGNTGSPSLGVTLDEDDEHEEESEYLRGPMYESEIAPEPYKETERQHPRAIPVVSEKHVLLSSVENEDDHTPNKTIIEAASQKLGPAYAAVSSATHAVASKIAGLTVATDTGDSASDSEMLKLGKGSETWDKGVSVKEYLMHKLEPGEDEKALSQAITDAISPRRTAGDVGVVEKVKGAVNSLLRSDDSSSSATSSPPVPVSTDLQQKKEAVTSLRSKDELFQSATRAENLSPPIPISTNPHQVIEDERILQAN